MVDMVTMMHLGQKVGYAFPEDLGKEIYSVIYIYNYRNSIQERYKKISHRKLIVNW